MTVVEKLQGIGSCARHGSPAQGQRSLYTGRAVGRKAQDRNPRAAVNRVYRGISRERGTLAKVIRSAALRIGGVHAEKILAER